MKLTHFCNKVRKQ